LSRVYAAGSVFWSAVHARYTCTPNRLRLASACLQMNSVCEYWVVSVLNISTVALLRPCYILLLVASSLTCRTVCFIAPCGTTSFFCYCTVALPVLCSCRCCICCYVYCACALSFSQQSFGLPIIELLLSSS